MGEEQTVKIYTCTLTCPLQQARSVLYSALTITFIYRPVTLYCFHCSPVDILLLAI